MLLSKQFSRQFQADGHGHCGQWETSFEHYHWKLELWNATYTEVIVYYHSENVLSYSIKNVLEFSITSKSNRCSSQGPQLLWVKASVMCINVNLKVQSFMKKLKVIVMEIFECNLHSFCDCITTCVPNKNNLKTWLSQALQCIYLQFSI